MQILGVNEIGDEKVFTMRFIQGRGPDWVAKSSLLNLMTRPPGILIETSIW